MLGVNPKEVQKRVDGAKAKLPRLIAKVALLPEAERERIGHLPTTVKTSRDVSIIEQLSERFGLDANTPAAVRPAPAHSLGAKVLEAVTNPAANAPALAGVKEAIDAHHKLIASPEYQKLSPRGKLESLKSLKHEEQMNANRKHEASCVTKRDAIIARSRAPFTQK